MDTWFFFSSQDWKVKLTSTSLTRISHIVLFFHIYLFLFVLGLSCGVAGSSVFIAAFRFFSCDMWILSCGMWGLVPQSGMEPGPPALGARSLSHWTTRKSLYSFLIVLGLLYSVQAPTSCREWGPLFVVVGLGPLITSSPPRLLHGTWGTGVQ